MTREELDFIGAMNMCDEISNEAYKKIVCHFEEPEPCTDAISRQAVLDLPKNTERGFGGKILEQSINIEYIKALPPVTPTEKVGKWINPTTMQCMKEQVFYYCSVCGNYADANKYCPNCGAKMQEVEE